MTSRPCVLAVVFAAAADCTPSSHGAVLPPPTSSVAPAAGPIGASQVVAIEASFSSHAGEGSRGLRRWYRDGCYQRDSVGGTGGGQAHDTEAGCAGAHVFARIFSEADAIVQRGGLARQGGVAGGARAGPGDEDPMGRTNALLILADGSRWLGSDAATRTQLARQSEKDPDGGLPTWYAEPASPPVGTGPQLLVVSVESRAHAASRLQASLSTKGSWWCMRSVPATDEPHLEDRRPTSLSGSTIAEMLAAMLRGVEAKDLGGGGELVKGERSLSAQTSLASSGRTAIASPMYVEQAVARFAAAMKDVSSACVPP